MSDYQYDEYEEDPAQMAYDQDPLGYTTELAAAAAQAAAELSRQQTMMDNTAIVASQAALTSRAVDEAMSAKYPEVAGQPGGWQSHKAEVYEVLQSRPHLLPATEAALLDANQLQQSFEDALEIARGVKRDAYADDRWNQIVKSGEPLRDLKKALGSGW
jgi:hypothetical protein